MKVRVLFFGATASSVGTRELDAVLDEPKSPADILSELATDHPDLKSHKLLFAVNEEYVDSNRPLNDGDELAIFTAVSGG
jgi:molybdopterin converting factor small subunit